MRVLLTGATGLIGSAILSRLVAEGHQVIGLTRQVDPVASRLPATGWIELDFSRALRPEDWRPYLTGIDAVVNAVGVLQDGPGASTRGVHRDGAAALFAACEQAGIRRVVHFSAIGVDRETPTAFSKTKLEGDQALMSRKLDWVILRPSVVVGRAAFGGSALFRGLAALPFEPVPAKAGDLQIVQLDDVTATVSFFLRPDAPARVAVELAGPDRLGFADVVRAYRRWLGFGKGPSVRLPAWAMAIMYRLGDIAGWLGWRPPIRTTAEREIVRGAVGDPERWTSLTGIRPRSLAAALAAEPSSVQERWFARLYFLKPVVIGVFALFWIMTGLISLGPGWDVAVRTMVENGPDWLAVPSVIAGAFTDLVVGIGILIRRTSRIALWAALAVSIFYVVAGTALAPHLWADPLGPMLKIWPIVALNLVALAILPDR